MWLDVQEDVDRQLGENILRHWSARFVDPGEEAPTHQSYRHVTDGRDDPASSLCQSPGSAYRLVRTYGTKKIWTCQLVTTD